VLFGEIDEKQNGKVAPLAVDYSSTAVEQARELGDTDPPVT